VVLSPHFVTLRHDFVTLCHNYAQTGICIEHVFEHEALDREHSYMVRSHSVMTALIEQLPRFAQYSQLADLYLAVQVSTKQKTSFASSCGSCVALVQPWGRPA
jgi:hypothetical protein